MKLALFGAYWQGNFGDDLMAYLFAKKLLEYGCQVRVFRPNPHLKNLLGIEEVSNLEDFTSNADACVYGGGGLFTSQARPAPPWFREISDVSHSLVDFLERRGTPTFMMSVGGDGDGRYANVPSFASRLLASKCVKAITTRLESDVELCKLYGKEASCYPDVVLATPLIQDYIGACDGGDHIGINLPDTSSNRGLVGFIRALRCLYPGAKIKYIQTHDPSSGHSYELSTRPANDNWRYDGNPINFLGKLRNCRLIVSSKLHVGLAACSYDVDFLSFRGSAKAVQAVGELGHAHCVTNSRFEVARAAVMTSRKAKLYDPSAITKASELALNHFEVLRACLNGLSRKGRNR